jgi:hypothetical protein
VIRGLDAAVARITERIHAATERGTAAALAEVVDKARGEWPRDTGASSRQLAPRGGRLTLTGYAPFVRLRGASREAWRELIADRLTPERAAARVVEEIRRG